MSKDCKDLLKWIRGSYAICCGWDSEDRNHFGGEAYTGDNNIWPLEKVLTRRGYPNRIEVCEMNKGWRFIYNG